MGGTNCAENASTDSCSARNQRSPHTHGHDEEFRWRLREENMNKTIAVVTKKLCISVALTLLVFAPHPVSANALVHKFEAWGLMDQVRKTFFYQGWTNGFFIAKTHGFNDKEMRERENLENCLGAIDTMQAVAMIDKYYKEHPEKWSNPVGLEILQALTTSAPCVGKNPNW
jgi:hypothetical protein